MSDFWRACSWMYFGGALAAISLGEGLVKNWLAWPVSLVIWFSGSALYWLGKRAR